MCSLGIYNKDEEVLYISDELNSKESINKILSDGYFTSKNLKDILTHELTHKNIGGILVFEWDTPSNVVSLFEKIKDKLDFKVKNYTVSE